MRGSAIRPLAAVLLLMPGALSGIGWAGAQTAAVEQRADAPPRGADLFREILAGPEARITDELLTGAETRWLRHRALAASGDSGEAALAARELLDWTSQRGIGRLPAIARAALLEARGYAGRGKKAFAVESYRLARTLDPALAEAWWGEARIEWARGERTRALALYRDGVRALVSRPLAPLLVATWFVRLLLIAAVLTGGGVILALLALHGPRVAGAIGERLPPRWHPAWRTAVGWLVVTAPPGCLVLGAWAFVAWAVLLVPALSRRERLVVWAWLALLVVATPALRGLSALEAGVHDDRLQAVLAAAEQRPTPGLVAELATLAGRQRGEAVWPVLLARFCAREYPDRAVQLLRDAGEIAPGDARIRIMLGNIFYRMGKHETAGVLYREAAELDPHSALARLNHSRVRLAAFEFADADRLADSARRADPVEYRSLVARLDDDEVGDPGVPAGEITAAGLHSFVWPRVRGELTGVRAATLAALAALLAALALAPPGFRIERHRCSTCGAVHTDAGADGDAWGRCSACRQLFSGLESLAPAARDVQSRRVALFVRHRTIGRAIAQLVWPGLALVHDGRALLGTLMAFAAAFCAVLTAATVFDPLVHGLVPGWPRWSLAAGACALVWLVAQLPGLRPRAAGTEWSR